MRVMRALWAATAAMAAMLAGHAAAADQFDLVCKGVVTRWNGQTEQRTATIAVDIPAAAFCLDACGHAASIQRVEPGRLVFYEREERTSTRISRKLFAVDRASGKLEMSDTVRGTTATFSDVWSAQCEVAPFTPLPANRF